MILVVSPNLSLDRTHRLDRLRPGSVHRCQSTVLQPGGKGVNVMRALASLESFDSVDKEWDASLCGFQGGSIGEEIASGLDDEGIPFVPVAMEHPNRVCTIVVDSTGSTHARATVINEVGPQCHISDTATFEETFDGLLPRAQLVAFMGSLPPGIAPELFHRLIHRCRRRGLATLLDSSGDALRLGIEASPTIVCPNLEEAETLAGRALSTTSDRVRFLREIRDQGAQLAVITMGAEGAIGSTPEWCARFGTRDEPTVENATGAGDAFAAGILAGRLRGLDDHESVRLAIASATASLERGYGRFPRAAARSEATWFEPLED